METWFIGKFEIETLPWVAPDVTTEFPQMFYPWGQTFSHGTYDLQGRSQIPQYLRKDEQRSSKCLIFFEHVMVLIAKSIVQITNSFFF